MIIISRLEEIMAQKNVSVDELVEKSGISAESIGLAQGKRIRTCSLESLIYIAKALDININELYEINFDDKHAKQKAAEYYAESTILPCLICGSIPTMESYRPKGRLQDVYRLTCSCGQACLRWSVTSSAAIKSWNSFAAETTMKSENL